MKIRFIPKEELLLSYQSDDYTCEEIKERLDAGEEWHIGRCFFVSLDHFRSMNEYEMLFCVGYMVDDYYCLDPTILQTEHKFYFSKTIRLKPKHFIAHYQISILSKIDQLIDYDMYIGGNYSSAIPEEEYDKLIDKFPGTTELKHYANNRISTIISQYLPLKKDYEEIYFKYLNYKEKGLANLVPQQLDFSLAKYLSGEIKKYRDVYYCLCNLLEHSDTIHEDVWQMQIRDIIRLIYPQYITGIREITIEGVDAHKKRPDFLLVDANGYIDILEIKLPTKPLLSPSQYRNNYVPSNELSWTIQQVEKYLYCLNTWGKRGENVLKQKLSKKIPNGITPKIANPRGMLLIGQCTSFDEQKTRDFEIIRRQYKHIADIITYDDLLNRLQNTINAYEMKMKQDAVDF